MIFIYPPTTLCLPSISISLYKVLKLLEDHKSYEEGEVREKGEKVESLLALYRQVENSGHRELNQIRGVATSLEWRWAQFHSNVEQRRKNLQLSLRFQENLFEVRNVYNVRNWVTLLCTCTYMYYT